MSDNQCQKCDGTGLPLDWYCPTCKDYLSGSRVTFNECCDTCGTKLTDVVCPECDGTGKQEKANV